MKNLLKSKSAQDVKTDFMAKYANNYWHNKSHIVSCFKVVGISGKENESIKVKLVNLRTGKTETSPYKDFKNNFQRIQEIQDHIEICNKYIESITEIRDAIIKETNG